MTNAYSALWFKLFMPLQAEEWTQKDIAFLSRQLPLSRYRRVLDLCCGYGRHALPLAKLGYQMTGLDRDEAAIAEAKRCAAEAGLETTYIVSDMRQIEDLRESFDAIINMWQSFSYFDEETNAALMRQTCHKLTPRGRFIIDMYNRNYFERHQGHKSQEIDGVTVETHGYLQGNRWHALLKYRNENGDLGEDHMEWQIFTVDEFRALAARCGFATRLVCTWSDEHIMPSPDIPRMQIVLEKL